LVWGGGGKKVKDLTGEMGGMGTLSGLKKKNRLNTLITASLFSGVSSLGRKGVQGFSGKGESQPARERGGELKTTHRCMLVSAIPSCRTHRKGPLICTKRRQNRGDREKRIYSRGKRSLAEPLYWLLFLHIWAKAGNSLAEENGGLKSLAEGGSRCGGDRST